MTERFDYRQPAIPGLDGPEWDNPQPQLPTEYDLTDNQLIGVLDKLHTSIDNAETEGAEPDLADKILHAQLGELAMSRGLISTVDIKDAPSVLEINIAEVSESLNNPNGMTRETRKELEDSLAAMVAEYQNVN